MAILEKALIVSLLIGVAIYGLGTLGQSITEHMNVLSEKFYSAKYSELKKTLQNFANDPETATMPWQDRIEALTDMFFAMTNQRRTYEITDEEFENLMTNFRNIVGDPPNASDKYYEYKEEALGIYNSEDSDQAKYDALSEMYGAAYKRKLDGLSEEESMYIYGIAGSLSEVFWERIYHPYGEEIRTSD